MDQLDQTSQQLIPYWLVMLSVYLGLGATIALIVDVLIRLWRSPYLKLVLTDELFFRLLENGESLYVNAILIANDSGALVQDVSIELEKSDGASRKSLQLRIRQIGEKQRIVGDGHEYYFYSSSPTYFVPENNMERVVYLCTYQSYDMQTERLFADINEKLSEVTRQYVGAPTPWSEETVRNVDLEVKPVIKRAVDSLMDKVQIEEGNYNLKLSIKYRQKMKMLPINCVKNTMSKLTFKVDGSALAIIRNQLEKYLNAKAYTLLTGQQPPIQAYLPEYAPKEIKIVN